MSVIGNKLTAQCYRWVTHLEGFVQNVGHLVLEVLRRSEGTCEQEAARTASVHADPGWEYYQEPETLLLITCRDTHSPHAPPT